MFKFDYNSSHYEAYCTLAKCLDGLGSVMLSRHIPSGTLLSVKKFNMDHARDDSESVRHEISVLRQLQHPNILSLHGAFGKGQYVLIVLPLMSYGSCRDLLNAHFFSGLPEAAIACVLEDVIQGLEYLHRRGIVHRALRASHILVAGNGRVCITGFRYSCSLVENGKRYKSLHSFPPYMARNLNWLSPEVLEQNMSGFNEKCDVYSLGVTTCELANGIIPFANMPTTVMLIEKIRGYCPQLLDCTTIKDYEDDLIQSHRKIRHPTLASNYLEVPEPRENYKAKIGEIDYSQRRFSISFHQFTELCLLKDQVLRPSASILLNHAFVKTARRNANGGSCLPELLHPVTPIGDHHIAPHNDLITLVIPEGLEDCEVQPEIWDF